MKKKLISICTFKEGENILSLLEEIRKFDKGSDILIIDDSPEDHIEDILKKFNDNKINLIQRKSKFGLGSALKLSLIYSIKNNYDLLIQMDADFSHHPKYLPEFNNLSNHFNFVIGSRFCEGGKSDYTGVRKYISIFGNFFTVKMLNINLCEITTSYRLYDVNLLKKLPFEKINRNGYSMLVLIVWYLNKLKANMTEIPIHFYDRKMGKSKLPKTQILVSAIDVLILKFKDLFFKNKITSCESYKFNKVCDLCQNNIFSKVNGRNKHKCLTCFNII